ncbi:MAG: hypothetical protein PHZ09_03580 [Eubacteriales bacterium]|jgi:hypothetical protein|nr:hypothetical protein [Eubacteriales bacterium]
METNHRGAAIPKITVVTLLVVSVLLAALSAFSPLSAFGLIFTAVAAASAAFVCGSVGSLLPLLTGIAAYGLALFFFGNPVRALTACAFVVCALVMNEARRRRLPRTKTVLAISAAYGTGGIIYILLALTVNWGGLSAAAFTAVYDAFISGIVESFASVGFSEDIIDTLIEYLLVLSPSLSICLLFIVGYLTTVFYMTLHRVFRSEPAAAWRIEMSMVSAVVFFVSYAIIAVLSTSKINAVSLAAENIIIILTPGLAIIGIRRTIAGLKTGVGRFRPVLTGIIVLFLIFYNISLFVIIISLLGAADTLANGIRKYRMKPK